MQCASPASSRPRHAAVELGCPIPPAAPFDAPEIQARSERWAVAMGLTHEGSSRAAELAAARLGWLAARGAPHLNIEAVQVVADWLTLAFFHDELYRTLVAPGGSVDLALISVIDERILAVLRAEGEVGDDAFSRAASSIQQRVSRSCSTRWRRRVADRVAFHFAELRTHRRLRPRVSAMVCAMDLVAAFVDAGDPGIDAAQALRDLSGLACEHLAWVNDAHDLWPDLARGDEANLVVAMARTEALEPAVALHHALVECNAIMAELVRAAARVDALADPESRPYSTILARWVRANLDWRDESARVAAARMAGARTAAVG